jgi:hypothetical protein
MLVYQRVIAMVIFIGDVAGCSSFLAIQATFKTGRSLEYQGHANLPVGPERSPHQYGFYKPLTKGS